MKKLVATSWVQAVPTRWLCILATICCFISTPSAAWALDMTSTGFYYPTGSSKWPATGGNWMSRDAAHGGGYVDGYYHIAQDMPIGEGSAVYPISGGKVVKIYTTYAGYIYVNGVKTYTDDVYGLGTGNSVMFVQHTLQDGTPFLAEYMHVRPTVREQDQVVVGHSIATVGPYQYDVPHLHFGIHPDTTWPTNYWGRMPNEKWADPNGFVNPIDWITTRSPQGFNGSNDIDIYVGGGGGAGDGSANNPYNTIRAAIDRANITRSVTIHIKPGTYGEKVSTSKHILFVTWGSGTVKIGG